MRRRILLRRVGIGAVTITGVGAGCLDDGDSDSDRGTDSDGADDETAGDDSTSPSIASKSIETTAATCASGEEVDSEATVDAERDRVEITGCIEAPNPCHEAVLSAVEFATDGTVSVTVDVVSEAVDVCQECLARIEYAATIEFEGGVPERITVRHATTAGEEDVVVETEIGAATSVAGESSVTGTDEDSRERTKRPDTRAI
ncbi:hypothetical protein [Halosolutus halophilus]|uniref:hypothetical protein n=1 Tax=Halosolutus halophilus TaxID=1552990 RepID=UPI0022352136|nr:hypothetical protein [Halosolutus halophilus]